MLAPDTVALLSWINLYFNTFTEQEYVDFDKMHTLLGLRKGDMTADELSTLKAMMRNVQSIPDTDAAQTVAMVSELAYSGEVAAITRRYQAGDEVDFVQEMRQLQRKYSDSQSAQSTLLKWEDRDIGDILSDNDEEGGLRFTSLPQLANTIRGLRGGDCVAVAAPVDAGKTSLLSVIATDFAEQMHKDKEMYGDRPILWLVNESLASRTVPRIYQAATHLTLQQIREQHDKGEFAGKYLEKVGDAKRIRVKDAHSITMAQISTLLEEMRPAVLVVDMVANIKGGSADSEHQALEAKWQDLRVLGCEYDCIIVGTMQLSAEGYNMLYPPMTALKQSKIGVQGALDLLIMMGRLNAQEQPMMHNIRGISTPKNKLGRSGSTSLHQFEVEFNGGTCKFVTGA